MKTKKEYYISFTDNPEMEILHVINDIKYMGRKPLKIYIDSVHRNIILDQLVSSTGKLKEPGMKLKTFYGLPIVNSKQFYITYE